MKRQTVEAQTFKVGDQVSWSSQSGGYVKSKSGTVAEVVPAKRSPSRELFDALYKGAGVGLPRDHQSYVVMVGSRPYWPRALALRPSLAVLNRSDDSSPMGC